MTAMGERAERTPLDIVDWPSVGEEVLYRMGDGSGHRAAVVLKVASHDGDLDLDTGDGSAVAALDVKHGPGLHEWQRYEESHRG